MNNDEPLFEEFLAARLKDKSISLKRLAEATGIAPTHLENLLHGNFEAMPSAPYFRGYIIRIGKVLDFDGEEWWEKIRDDDLVRNSGPADALPHNRFMKREVPKTTWVWIAVGAVIIAYLIFSFRHIVGKPVLTIGYPSTNPYTTSSSTLTLTGNLKDADLLYLSNDTASSGEEIRVAPDGSWEKMVLLQGGPNDFVMTAKKFLGRETTITQRVIYEISAGASTTASSSFPVIHTTPEVPATGTFFN